MRKGLNKIKQTAVIFLITVMLFGPANWPRFNRDWLVLAEDASPSATPVAPSAPAAPTEPSTPAAPAAPTAPKSPTLSAPPPATLPATTTTESPATGTANPTENSATAKTQTDSGPTTTGTSAQTQTTTGTTGSSVLSPDSTATGGVINSGNVGNTTVKTGSGLSSGTVITTANSNMTNEASGSGALSNGANTGNGSESINTAGTTSTNRDNTVQTNTANVQTGLNLATVTGSNISSKNVGDTQVTTGDANVNGTVVTAVNTNVDEAVVATFNVADNHTGDIILAPQSASSVCPSGCGAGSAADSGNGADSTNTASVSAITNPNTFQANTADVGSTLILTADSGSNQTNKNTGGDSTITTGDANVSGSAVNFLNNNLAGGVLYNVVNIYGNLIGDIILPPSAVATGSGQTTPAASGAANIGNGTGSQKTAGVTTADNSRTFQANAADIGNNMVLSANTGTNNTSGNTNGDAAVQSGTANVLAKSLTVANTNVSNGTVWLVLINEAGHWVGQILGAPAGATSAGSEGTTLSVAPNGNVSATNTGNGADSNNLAQNNSQTNATVSQSNLAKIMNKLLLTANTGSNMASDNTGGDSTIKTGDATVIANILNFVNNNISADGRLVVTVINVFGSWIGDFVPPGQTPDPKPVDNNPAENSQTATTDSSTGTEVSQPSSTNSQQSEQTSGAPAVSESKSPAFRPSWGDAPMVPTSVLAAADSAVAPDLGLLVPKNPRLITVNLAWLLIILPGLVLLGITIRRLRESHG